MDVSKVALVENLIKKACESKEPIILKKVSNYYVLKTNEVPKLNHYNFNNYFKETGHKLLSPILLASYGLKSNFRDRSFSYSDLVDVAKIYVANIGIGDYLDNLRNSSGTQLTEGELIDLFSKALAEEIRERGIINEIDMIIEGK